MKKRAIGILGLCMLTGLTAGCGKQEEKDVELTVFAAASMTETLTELGDKYMEENENVTVQFNFDSSGTLLTQIEEGADCDIFISAGQKQMDQLEDSDGLQKDSRFDILENKVVLAVPQENPAGVSSYEDLKTGLETGTVLLAMGNADVPVGQYTQKIFDFFGLKEADLAADGLLTYGSNVKEVTTQISEGTVDCGIIYETDACSAGLTVVDTATVEMCGQVIYPAAVLKDCKNEESAQKFLEYLKSDEADSVFEKVGFTPVG